MEEKLPFEAFELAVVFQTFMEKQEPFFVEQQSHYIQQIAADSNDVNDLLERLAASNNKHGMALKKLAKRFLSDKKAYQELLFRLSCVK
ncbi:hypothetical protein [Pseudobacillus badius]|uniref:hypothetical protein n=1 Tax=Bacillus badius TaxID=1455 RepID=UPI000597A4D0|nr:hypothetical protein [Bacillus badius]KIL74692.1 hypothetical protein SD78_1761 [Bacillus badius]UAT32444.1 hypothetical protein K7T73_09645 [Bacillus badius]GLY12719.1 hypothetical protein Bbad01_39350 [Bacillus badius]